jgi:hypothetical protein
MNRLSIAILYPLCAILLFTAPGCTLFGVLAGKVVPPPMIQPKYTGLKDQTVAIMVWAGDGTLIDFPDVRLDIAGGLQTKLQQAKDVKTKSLAGITFPVTTASVVRYQENHPENEAKPLTEIAPKLKTSRVIYVEIENLQTRSNASVELYRGSASATLKVVEVPPDGGPATIAYEESGIEALFPPKAREEGTPAGNDFVIYRGTVDALTTEIAKRFVPYQEEQ